MNRSLRPPLLAVCLACLWPAAGSAMELCHLRKTPDGFVALRAGPGPQHRLIARMKPEDEVQYGQGRQGKWVEVTWWRGDSRLEQDGFSKGVHGWAFSPLIAKDCG
ncbi:hypothetical protein ACETRX_19405 [Labrys portucalensis]|uniref:SH3 domain-containing protein n=1 Tax=Labrys neptuniae TaxID=376174 RepID=A0ABV6ZI49_9HYPH